MKLDNHIGYRFLVDDSLAWEIVERMHPEWTNWTSEFWINALNNTDGPLSPELQKIYSTYILCNFDKQKAYYITETVLDKLDLLKVKRSSMVQLIKPIHGASGTREAFDWTVFKDVSDRKVTLILPDNRVVRLNLNDKTLHFLYITAVNDKTQNNWTNLNWTMFYVDRFRGAVSENYFGKQVQEIEEFLYKLMCFIYLSENEEVVIAPGARYGTKKHGKIINSLPFSLTTVTSKWNVTSIRTEGFDVSGHFRLQPTNTGTKMIFIEPFRKHGYIRKAKSTEEK